MNISDYKYTTELHAHTSPASPCSEMPPEEVIKTYSGLGYTSIVISNHFFPWVFRSTQKDEALSLYLEDFHKAQECGKKHGVNVILGCEIRFPQNSNDYLLFGIDEEELSLLYDKLGDDIESFSKWFRKDGHILIQAHPFRNGMVDVSPTILDGIEAYNMHPNHNSRIGFSAKYAENHDMIVTCGTDYHHPSHEGMCAMLTKEPMRDSNDLAEVLKSRDYLFEIGGNIVLPYGNNTRNKKGLFKKSLNYKKDL